MNNLLKKYYGPGPFGFYGGGAGAGGTGTSGTSGQTYGTSGTSGASGMTPSDYLVNGKLATNQTIPQNADTVVNLTDNFDPQGWLTTNKFQPNVAGYYQVSYNVTYGIGVGTGQVNIQLRKNGATQLAIAQAQINTVDNLTLTDALIVYYNGTTDYTEITAYTSTSNPNQVLQSGSGTQFSAMLIGYGGLDGSSGTSGADGASGSSGTSGSTGLTGTAGTSGATGSSGTSGVGSAGTSGATGSSGTSGVGTAGTSGSSGVSGNGTGGTSGATGSSGTSGVGSAGTSGATGSSGTSGVGTAGTAGTSGATGASGSSGTSGVGSAGTSGASGTSGTSSAAAGATYLYKIVVATTGGTISGITSATAPSGANLIGAPGWSISISGVNVIVNHPLGNTVISGFSLGVNAGNNLIRPYTGNSAAQFAMFASNSFGTLTFYSNTAANAGFNGAATDANALTINFLSTVSS
jgi:hypothetical protein